MAFHFEDRVEIMQPSGNEVPITVSSTALPHLHSSPKCFTMAFHSAVHSHTIVDQWEAAAVQRTATPIGTIIDWDGVGFELPTFQSVDNPSSS